MFDIRITPSVDHDEFEATIKRWCEEAGSDVTYSFEEKNPKIENTKLDESNPYWIAFKNTCDEIGINLETAIFPGGTDGRFVREVSIRRSLYENLTFKYTEEKIYYCYFIITKYAKFICKTYSIMLCFIYLFQKVL